MLKDEEPIDLLKNFIDTNVLFRADPDYQYNEESPKGRIPSKGFGQNSHQYYMRRISHDPVMLDIATQLMVNKIIHNLKIGNEFPQFQICGMETGSLPLISAIQIQFMKMGLPIKAFSVRKERKAYGLFNFIEGDPDKNLPYIVIDDLTNSGSSIRRLIDTVEYELGLPYPKNIYTIMNMNRSTILEINDKEYCIINALFDNTVFSLKYDASKYWLPDDVNRNIHRRLDYK